jgi:hypothetical protein
MKRYGGWIKTFYDGKKEYGFDDLIKTHKSSWSKGQLHNIEEVTITNDQSCSSYILAVPNTEWHQFDRFYTILNGSSQSLTYRAARVIQAKINNFHIGMNLSLHKMEESNNIESFYYLEHLREGCGYDNIITKSAMDKWLSLILLPNDTVAVQLTQKGQVSWQEVHI